MAYGFFRRDFQELDAKGNPIYSGDKITVLEKPKGVGKVARDVYWTTATLWLLLMKGAK